MNNFLTTLLILEERDATQEEYDSALMHLYNDEQFVEYSNHCDTVTARNYGLHPVIKTTGNIFVKYAEKRAGNKNIIIVMGMISKSGKMTREDYPDVKRWMDLLTRKIKDGATLITSVNEESKPFIINMTKRNKFQITYIDSMRYNGKKWETIQVNA